MFGRNSITPPTSDAATRARSCSGSAGPSKPTESSCPTCAASFIAPSPPAENRQATGEQPTGSYASADFKSGGPAIHFPMFEGLI